MNVSKSWPTRLKQWIKYLAMRRARPALLILISLGIVLQIVALSPSNLEESPGSLAQSLDPESLYPSEAQTLVPGIPKNRVPEYSVDDFHYVSTHESEKEWSLQAKTAYLYNPEQIVYSQNIRALLYDPEGKTTVVTGREAKYVMAKKDLEVFGDVKTVFPDGFELNSPYLRYRPDVRKIEIPEPHPVFGKGKMSETPLTFESLGLDYDLIAGKIKLLQNVEVVTGQPRTTLKSDICLIDRKKNVAEFTMNPNSPLRLRFVKIKQPTLDAESRRADLGLGGATQAQKMTLWEDVQIREKDKSATCGRADFDMKKNLVILTLFPQVYQDHDTVTGERIVIHRDTDIVEVEHSNAFSHGLNK